MTYGKAYYESKEKDFCPYCRCRVSKWKIYQRNEKWYKKCTKGHELCVKNSKPVTN